MEILSRLDSWDYIMIGLFLMGDWLLLGGIKTLKKANPETVDETKIRNRAFGGIVVSIVYLGVKFFYL